MKLRHLALLFAIGLVACSSTPLDGLSDLAPVEPSTVPPAPQASPDAAYRADSVEQGRYMVRLLGCGACHTDGALIGAPNPARLLAGSSVGLAYSSPLQVDHPAVIFPPNLTPDRDTGIGEMNDEQLKRAIRHGISRGGLPLKGMPTAALAQLKDSDVDSIIAYLRSLPPVAHAVPDRVQEGQPTDTLYVHFGVYQSRRGR